MNQMTLSVFLRSAPVTLEAFRAATMALHAKEPSTTPLVRDEVDWWQEIAAYMQYTELEEQTRQEPKG